MLFYIFYRKNLLIILSKKYISSKFSLLLFAGSSTPKYAHLEFQIFQKFRNKMNKNLITNFILFITFLEQMKLFHCFAPFLYTVALCQQPTFMQNCSEAPTPEARRVCFMARLSYHF